MLHVGIGRLALPDRSPLEQHDMHLLHLGLHALRAPEDTHVVGLSMVALASAYMHTHACVLPPACYAHARLPLNGGVHRKCDLYVDCRCYSSIVHTCFIHIYI